ncbi:unnamed protein product [Chrysodeixis includens]|uniref:Condensin complex subunit 2 n=1 Tax=Chrysodeixis includens TaxID=689277 RepID=A0A9P0FT24_CHRIL|nr:unnamed protein product [Chrysodeixis includens]
MSTPGLNRISVGGSSNSSIRRRTLIPQTRPTGSKNEERNDDDAERSSLVASERAMATSTPHAASPRRGRDTMSSSPQKEHFQGCLKLYAENKITKDNAWNLQLIDFMSSMLRRHDSRMENLQTASTVVDASARIYSFRVDAVHYDVLKMAGGLVKAAQTKRGKKDDDDVQDEGAVDGNGAAVPQKKKKKRSKGAIAANPEVFNGDFDTNDCIDPFFERLAATTGDVTASNRAFNATLPIHDKTLSLILRTDDRFLEEIKENIPEEGLIDLTECITISSKLLPAFTESDHICEPFTGFSISNWDPNTEDTDNRVTNWVEENRLNLSQQALAFDVNAEVEPIPLDEQHNDLYDDEPLGGIESEEEADVAVAACVARAGGGAGAARLADMRPAGVADSRLEYSYCGAIVAAWAGPAHWRLKNNRTSKMTERTQSTAGRLTVEGKKPPRTKRQLDFLGAGLAFDCRSEPVGEYEPTQPAKIMISRKTLATGHTWNEANFKTPIDRGLDESHFRKLFLRQNVMMLRKRDLEQSKQPEPEPVTVEEARDYDYNNENDASYCPNNIPDGDDWGNEDATAAGEVHEQVKTAEPEEITDMLEPPTKVAKIFIPYAVRAKKVDMKQLKHCTWKMLTENSEGDKEEVAPTTFFSLYSKLPSKLSPNMRESLSVPLALLSMLHLANEKGLVLEKREDMKDIGVLGLLK